MGKKKSSDEIRVNFLGSSTTGVTGSSIEVDIPFLNTKFLYECGQCQEYSALENYNANLRIINSVDIENTKFILVAHQHIDHISNILGLVNRGFNGKIYCTYEASKMLQHLFTDAAFLHDKECKQLSARSKKNVTYKPFMTEKDIYKAMELIEAVEYNKVYELNNGAIKFEFLRNNHIVGASSIQTWIRKPNNSVKKIWYSSDLGSSICKNYYVSDLEISHNNTISILESTYGNKPSYNKQDRKREIKLIEDTIREAVLKKKANILIPVFSMSRLQFMMTLLYEIMHDKEEFYEIPVIADTRLGMNITKEYKEVLQGNDLELFTNVTQWEQMHQVCSYDETLACSNDPTPKIVLAASGFLSSGTHATVYLKKWLGNPNNCVIFCGYSGGDGSLGARVRDDATKTISIDGTAYRKNCNVKTLQTFSSHIQSAELVSLAKQINTEKIILHHGSSDAKAKLKEVMTEELRACGKSTTVVIAEKGMSIVL